jgi:hypothetical protein
MSLSILPHPNTGQQSPTTTGPPRRAHLRWPSVSPNSGGGVVGINSRGVEDQYNFVSLTSAALSVSFEDVTVETQHYPIITIQQLIDLGHVLLV